MKLERKHILLAVVVAVILILFSYRLWGGDSSVKFPNSEVTLMQRE